MKKFIIKFTATIILFNAVLNSQGVFAANSSSLQNEIEKNNEQIDALERQKDNIKQQKNNMSKDLESILSSIDSKNAQLAEANKNVETFQNKIDELQGKINSFENNIKINNNIIREKELFIQTKEIEREETEKLLGNRLRNYYKNNMSSQIIFTLLKSDSFTSLINNIKIINKLIEVDSNLINLSKQIAETVEQEKKTIQEETDKLNVEKEQIKVMQNEQIQIQKNYKEEKNKYESQMSELKELENQKQSVVNSLSDEEKELQEKIGDLNAYNDDLQEKINSLFDTINRNSSVKSNVSSGEGFLMPANGPLTSPYGPRIHPIFGSNGFHTGIDIGAANNSPIYASKSGKIVFAGVQSGYGNTVIVDHGGGVQTLYAHANAILVSNGQTVTRGQVIAKVGSTGNSTGPHLHFEVRINGKHQNPSNYLN